MIFQVNSFCGSNSCETKSLNLFTSEQDKLYCFYNSYFRSLLILSDFHGPQSTTHRTMVLNSSQNCFQVPQEGVYEPQTEPQSFVILSSNFYEGQFCLFSFFWIKILSFQSYFEHLNSNPHSFSLTFAYYNQRKAFKVKRQGLVLESFFNSSRESLYYR